MPANARLRCVLIARLTAGVCIIHLIRNTFRLASKRDWDALKRDVKPIYTAVNAAAARAALEELAATWGASGTGRSSGCGRTRGSSSSRSWIRHAIRKVMCSTNAIVIWSPRGGVLHVDHERLRGRDPRCGRGYLPLSITRISGGNHACSAGAVARLVA